MTGFWHDEQVEYYVDNDIQSRHTHSYRIEIESIPDSYLDCEVSKRGFVMEQRVFAYCDCGKTLNEKEITRILNKAYGLDE
jgi:hypothetical protein